VALLLSTIVSLLLAELVVRMFVPVHDVGPSTTLFDEELGIRLKPNFVAVRKKPEFTMKISTNREGRRGPLAEPGEGGIVFMGDSYTMGIGVNDGEEYPQIVAELLDGALPIHNFGVAGTGNDRWLKLLKDDVSALEPKAMVFQVCFNDFGDNVNGLYQFGSQGELVARPPLEPSLARRAKQILEAVPLLPRTHLYGLLRQTRIKRHSAFVEAPPEEPGLPSDEITYAILTESLAWCADRKIPSLVLLVGVTREERTDRLKELARACGSEAYSIPWRHERPDLHYESDLHWNAEGHRFVAQLVHEKLLGLGVQ